MEKYNNNKLMSIDEFVNHIKSNKEYQRTSNDAIKTNIQKILNEIIKYIDLFQKYIKYIKRFLFLLTIFKNPHLNISV